MLQVWPRRTYREHDNIFYSERGPIISSSLAIAQKIPPLVDSPAHLELSAIDAARSATSLVLALKRPPVDMVEVEDLTAASVEARLKRHGKIRFRCSL